MSDPVLIVCGSRHWVDYPRLAEVLDNLIWPVCQPIYSAIWHGGARGADRLAAHYAAWRGREARVWPADWGRYGRGAGVRRSAEMIAAAPPGSLLVAFVPGRLAASPGTAHEVRLARRRGLAVVIVDCCGLQRLPADPYVSQLEV